MLEIGALLVDFDGTACSADVSEILLDRFGGPGWEIFDEAVDRGEMGLREAAHLQSTMLGASREEMLAYAVEHCPLDPTFPEFAEWAEEHGLPLTLVSDGFSFYVRPILEKAGLGRLPVVSNELRFTNGIPKLRHPNGHPECVGCGTCKMLAVLDHRARFGPVAFVGEGQSDRYGALYADLVFAKKHLVDICERDGIQFVRWETFDDVRDQIASGRSLPGAVAPDRCPGWRSAQ